MLSRNSEGVATVGGCPKTVIHLFNDGDDAVVTGTRVAQRIQEIAPEHGCEVEAELTRWGLVLRVARDEFLRFTLERATVVSF
jgi:hypothetical protein